VVASGQVSGGDQRLHHQFVGSGFKHSSVWVGTFRKPSSGFAKPCASNRRREIPHTPALSSEEEQQQQRVEEELLARTLEAPSSAKDTSSSSSLRFAQESDGSQFPFVGLLLSAILRFGAASFLCLELVE
jgi:hypothetical protein